jgi:hypothetical protein
MAEKEVVLEVGVEGGGATIYRTLLASGGWQYHVEGSSMYLDENDDEDWRSWTTEPVDSVRVALQSIAEDGSWVFFYPTSVHPEHGKIVWELAQEAASRLTTESSKVWTARSRDWQRLCLERS